MYISVTDVVFGFDQRHLLTAARQTEFEGASLDVNGQVDVGVDAVDVGDQTQRCHRAKLESSFQYLLLVLIIGLRAICYRIT